MKRLLIIWIVLLASLGCQGALQGTLTQVSVIDAILAGDYDGRVTLKDLLKKGDTGLGTFDGLNGEMVVMDGRVYQVTAAGSVQEPGPETKTPFAALAFFTPEWALQVEQATDKAEFGKKISEAAQNPNLFLVIRAHGQFRTMLTRSVPKQSKPYPPLVEVTKNQPTFPMENVTGDIVGIYSPPFVQGVGVPGFHLHFLNQEKSAGGHILAFEMTRGTIRVDSVSRLNLILPQDREFAELPLGTDRSADLKKAEYQGKPK